MFIKNQCLNTCIKLLKKKTEIGHGGHAYVFIE